MPARRRDRLATLMIASGAAACLCLPAPPARAQGGDAAAAASGPSEPVLAEARARYRDGAQAYAEGRFKDAIDLFLEADRIRPSAALSFNIARGYEKLRDAAGALRWYRDYLRRAEKPADAEQVQLRVAMLEDALRRKGVQQVTISSEPPGATVVVDRNPMGVTPWTGELSPGAHHLELRMRGYDDAASGFELPADRAIDVRVLLEKETPAPATPAVSGSALAGNPAPSQPERAFPMKTWGFIGLGVAGAAFAGALTFELMRRSAAEDARNERVQIEFQKDVERVESRRTAARVLAGTGAFFALAGGALIAVDLLQPADKEPTAELRKLELACSSAGCNATWTRRF
ncbi:MAG TPA: PEGA domain-containing protein [Polyangiaceae bacterium]|nr:PEGA domain-containing protein [Polyangiaceae bacterium]